ncbi:hypothetical protein [Salmonella enterica]|uniref:hypothetical protein n=1 Tax=Salmonella enterica TaxID=28901 RepID=UPI00398C6D93
MSKKPTEDMTKPAQAEKARRENDAAELKRKEAEEARSKLAREAHSLGEGGRRMAAVQQWNQHTKPQ